MTAQFRTRGLPTFRNWGRTLLYGLVIPVVAVASLKIITLSEMVQKSDVIAQGHLRAASTGDRPAVGVASLQVLSVLKGKELTGQSAIPLCNQDVDSEHPDLAKLAGDYVMFVAKKGDCFYLVWGWDALIVVRSGRAHTAGIEDQPTDQPIEQFLSKIHSLVRKATRSGQ
jgi:hypothetical protein